MLMLIAVLVFLIVFLLVYSVLAVYAPKKEGCGFRLHSLEQITVGGDGSVRQKPTKPSGSRWRGMGAFDRGSAYLGRLFPPPVRQAAESKLAAAGGICGMDADQYLGWIALLSAGASVTVAVLGMAVGAQPVRIAVMAGILSIICLIVPLLLINQKIAERRNMIQKQLPDALDLLTVSVEAGLGFDAALVHLTEKMSGPLIEEFSRVLQEIRIGVPRRDALHAIGTRCKVDDLSIFVSSIVQADQLGVSISQVLRVQSVSMRDKRRQRAQELAMKAPVKMLLPMVVFIFPTIFVILLGPAAIQMIAIFRK